MKVFAFLLLLPCIAHAGPATMFGMPYPQSGSTQYPVNVNSSGQIALQLMAGEDQTNNVQKVEQQFSYNGYKAADTQIKASAGFVHTVTCAGTDATATAGTIILYDNTAESGTKIWQWDVQAVALTSPVTVTLDAVAATGLYLGFTTTADVACTVTYR